MCEAPIGERAFLLVITAFSAVITFASVLSFFFFLPITDVQSMVIRMDRSFDKVARVRPLVQQPSDDPNRAVLRWSLHNFVEAREAYDIDRQDMLHKRVYAIGDIHGRLDLLGYGVERLGGIGQSGDPVAGRPSLRHGAGRQHHGRRSARPPRRAQSVGQLVPALPP